MPRQELHPTCCECHAKRRAQSRSEDSAPAPQHLDAPFDELCANALALPLCKDGHTGARPIPSFVLMSPSILAGEKRTWPTISSPSRATKESRPGQIFPQPVDYICLIWLAEGFSFTARIASRSSSFSSLMMIMSSPEHNVHRVSFLLAFQELAVA